MNEQESLQEKGIRSGTEKWTPQIGQEIEVTSQLTYNPGQEKDLEGTLSIKNLSHPNNRPSIPARTPLQPPISENVTKISAKYTDRQIKNFADSLLGVPTERLTSHIQNLKSTRESADWEKDCKGLLAELEIRLREATSKLKEYQEQPKEPQVVSSPSNEIPIPTKQDTITFYSNFIQKIESIKKALSSVPPEKM